MVLINALIWGQKNESSMFGDFRCDLGEIFYDKSQKWGGVVYLQCCLRLKQTCNLVNTALQRKNNKH